MKGTIKAINCDEYWSPNIIIRKGFLFFRYTLSCYGKVINEVKEITPDIYKKAKLNKLECHKSKYLLVDPASFEHEFMTTCTLTSVLPIPLAACILANNGFDLDFIYNNVLSIPSWCPERVKNIEDKNFIITDEYKYLEIWWSIYMNRGTKQCLEVIEQNFKRID